MELVLRSPSRRSIASQISAGVSVPLNASIATMPVGEVTLISVSHWPPITSIPTNSSPRRFSSGPSAAQISSSRAVSSVLAAVAADREVGADFAFAGDAVDRAGDFAVDEHDALVALGDLGEELLDDVRLAVGAVEQLDQRGEVAAVGADPEHRPAGEAVQRLDDDLAMLGEELAREAERAGDRGRRHELREVEHPHLFGRVADAGGIVDHQRLVLDPLEQVRRGDVAEVERRVLAHQHDVDVAAEVEDSRLAEAVMVALRRAER